MKGFIIHNFVPFIIYCVLYAFAVLMLTKRARDTKNMCCFKSMDISSIFPREGIS